MIVSEGLQLLLTAENSPHTFGNIRNRFSVELNIENFVEVEWRILSVLLNQGLGSLRILIEDVRIPVM